MHRLIICMAAGAVVLATAAIASSTGTAATGPVRSASCSEHWQGTWRYKNQGGKGIMRLRQDGRTIEGRFTGGGRGGDIDAKAGGPDCVTMNGTYCNDYRKSGERSKCGYLVATVTGDGDSFGGSFRPWYQTTRYKWSGFRISSQ